MRILVMGQTTLHWGRMEFGNIGNYYIIEPFFRELHNVFNDAQIVTTFQMSERFSREEKVQVLPMDLYFGWTNDDLPVSLEELSLAYLFSKTGYLLKKTPFIDEILKADLVIDFSGDMWGSNADLLGKDRFLIGLIKDRISQLLGKKTVMIAGSPGPFRGKDLPFAQEVFRNFSLVTNRESISINVLEENGFDVSNVHSLACPAFLFEPKPKKKSDADEVAAELGLNKKNDKLIFGFVICGWNFVQGPFDRWPRSDQEYIPFAEAVEFITETLEGRVYLMSHSNGFPIPPQEFKLLHGRDYYVVKQLEKVLNDRGIATDFSVIEHVLDPWQTKAIISKFDIFISGRIHGAVAALSQNIPTTVIDYGHKPRAHKLRGFALEAGIDDYVANPAVENDIIKKIELCWANRQDLRDKLKTQMPIVQAKARKNFTLLRSLME